MLKLKNILSEIKVETHNPEFECSENFIIELENYYLGISNLGIVCDRLLDVWNIVMEKIYKDPKLNLLEACYQAFIQEADYDIEDLYGIKLKYKDLLKYFTAYTKNLQKSKQIINTLIKDNYLIHIPKK